MGEEKDWKDILAGELSFLGGGPFFHFFMFLNRSVMIMHYFLNDDNIIIMKNKKYFETCQAIAAAGLHRV